jgi:hypothetical protein
MQKVRFVYRFIAETLNNTKGSADYKCFLFFLSLKR